MKERTVSGRPSPLPDNRAILTAAGVAGLLFGLHPVHVESVAWIAERKDVLSTFFFLLTLLAYRSYVQRPAVRRYMLSLALFALGLMAKSMLVSLPIILFLFDYWPLGRLRPSAAEGATGAGRLVLEKLPLFVLSAAACADEAVAYIVAERSLGSNLSRKM